MKRKDQIQAFRENRYECPAPDGCHVNWTENDWINYIDQNGRFFPKPEQPHDDFETQVQCEEVYADDQGGDMFYEDEV